MLELIRRNHRLGTTVLWLCASLWLLAMLAGVQVRMPMQQWQSAGASVSVSTLAPAQSGATGLTGAAVHGDRVAAAAMAAMQMASADVLASAPASAPAHSDEHRAHDHHGMDCLLCMALSPPAVVAVPVYRPPVPGQGRAWWVPAHCPPAQQATAPLPARGPPSPIHVAAS